MGQKPTLNKRLLIALVIVVLVVASISAVMAYQQVTATKLSVTISTNQASISQGNSTKMPIEIILTGNKEKVELTGIANSSKITCSFDPANGSSSFNSTLTVNVDDSVQGGYYSVTVKASSPTTTTNASCIITVLTRNITVSGSIHVSLPERLADSGWEVETTSLMFKDTRTHEIITVKPYSHDQTFTVTLKNQDFYYLEATYGRVFVGAMFFIRTDTIGNLTVASAGTNMMPNQDFTLIPQF